jgi:hypothetical protein
LPRFIRLAVNDAVAQLAKRRKMVLMKNDSIGRRHPGDAGVKRQAEDQTAWQSMMPAGLSLRCRRVELDAKLVVTIRKPLVIGVR